ncbi:MAG: hypothetical protein FWG11_06160, partial [Promicromonosporaceae bacterium]|nr:hypothetical protein [Promicromonosporaceae bacterium]
DPAEQLAANAGLNLIPPGVAQLLAAGLRDDAARVQGAGAAIKAWDGCAGKALHLLEEGSGPAVGSDARRVAAAVKAYGRSGLATLLLAAAIGNDDARLLLARLLGDVPNGAVAALRDDLAARALGQVDAEFAAALAPLAGPHLEHDAAIGLRVRLAELRRQA